MSSGTRDQAICAASEHNFKIVDRDAPQCKQSSDAYDGKRLCSGLSIQKRGNTTDVASRSEFVAVKPLAVKRSLNQSGMKFIGSMFIDSKTQGGLATPQCMRIYSRCLRTDRSVSADRHSVAHRNVDYRVSLDP